MPTENIHSIMRCKTCNPPCFALAALACILALLGSLRGKAMAGINEDRAALVGFMTSADPSGVLLKNWSGLDPCAAKWDGIICYKGRVWHVLLQNKQLAGQIDANSLGKLDQLRKVSLSNNMLSGPIPNFQSLFLRCIWLSNNSFTGSIPDIFSHTPRFNKLDVSYNNLAGVIPPSLASVVKLDTLLLDHNHLTGSIPPFNQPSLLSFNVSYNELSGPIPNTSKLQTTFKVDSYMSNPQLCGPPVSPSCNQSQAPVVETKKKKASMSHVLKILLIVIADVILLCFLALLAVYCYKRLHKQSKAPDSRSKRELSNDPTMMSMEETGKTYDKASRNEEMTDAEKSKLVVFERPGRISFDLEELLRASAEMLGKGSFGTTYKAVFGGQDGHSTVVVKRLRDMQSAGKREFDTQMLVLGQLQHPNIVSLLAYYYAKDEKFLVVEYAPYGSLFSLLHGGARGPDHVPLNWDTRLKIAREVARGMAYLHKSLKSQKLPHGNLKSSNILVDEGMVPKVADFGMAPLLTQSGTQCMVAFKAPEYAANGAITAQADVHSFGIILLELLTGKVPLHSSIQGGEGIDLIKWVSSKAKEGDGTVYDEEMAKGADGREKEAMLEVAMRCVGGDAKGRPNMEEVLIMVEAIGGGEASMLHDEDGKESFVSDYNTPTQSFSSRRSSFQDFVSPPSNGSRRLSFQDMVSPPTHSQR